MVCEVEVVHDMFPLAISGHAVRTYRLDGSHSGGVRICRLIEGHIRTVPISSPPDYGCSLQRGEEIPHLFGQLKPAKVICELEL
jgi:hypothetical protein